MPRRLALSAALLAVLFVVPGCRKPAPKAEEEAAPQATPEARAHPLAQDGTTARAITSVPDRVRIKTDLGALRGAIRAYGTEHNGAYPASLAEIPVDGRINFPEDLDYDPTTGTLKSRTYPDD